MVLMQICSLTLYLLLMNAMASIVGCTALYIILLAAFLSQKNVMYNVKLTDTIRNSHQHKPL